MTDLTSGLPDYTRKMVLEIPDMGVNPLGYSMFMDVLQRPFEALVTTYLKEACIVMPYVTVASPLGNMVSYEGGYTCRALISKAGTGEVALAKACLDVWAALQNADGSWNQAYYPALNAAGSHDTLEDRQVDSGIATLIWAMADYDASQGGSSTVYKSAVQSALEWIYDSQQAFLAEEGVNLLCNEKVDGDWEYTALAADIGEVILAAKKCLDQYGDPLLTSGGHDVKTMINNLYLALNLYMWTGLVGRYYQTEYPLGAAAGAITTFKQKISFTQALAAWATKVWAASAYRTGTDYTANADDALEIASALLAGKWGGYLYSPWTGAATETRKEYPAYTALIVLAMNAVDSSKYANQIARGKRFIELAALRYGEVFDYVRPNGQMDVGTNTYYGFLALPSALGLLAGA